MEKQRESKSISEIKIGDKAFFLKYTFSVIVSKVV